MLLLVVLSLLVLFALIGITFVLVAGKHLSTTKMALRDEQRGEDPRKLCDAVLGQIVRGTTDAHSVLRGHDLLADLYGNDGVRGTVDNLGPSPIAGGQFVDLRVVESTTAPINPEAMFWYADMETSPGPPPVYSYVPIVSQSQMRTPGYYNGCVLTMLDGPAAGKSTRIVGWGYTSGPPSTYTIRVMAFEGIDATTTTISGPFIINGRPFNGTGFGFKPTESPTAPTLLSSQELVPTDANPLIRPPKSYALLPNPLFSRPTMPGVTPPHPPYPLFGGIGGADEEYDAADPQNMALAYLPLNPTPIPGAISIIPSFHRPDLIWHFGEDRFPGTFDETAKVLGPPPPPNWRDLEPAILRRIMLRPNPLDHPQFTGSNPDFNPILGPFDVDNDGDGIAESVWIDVGFPVQTAPDGRAYKPLAALLILDMDGRLNVNAHGNIAQLPGFAPATTIPGTYFAGGAVPSMRYGQGYGPTEIDLLVQLFGGNQPGFQNLLAERYREPNAVLTTSYYPSATSPYPGATGVDEALSAIKQTEFPVPAAPSDARTAYGTPADLWGQGFAALDVRGTVILENMGNQTDTVDDPYEFNLGRKAIRAAVSTSTPTSSTTPPDSPFTAAELERVLRMYDVDAAQLPDRLRTLVDGMGGPPLTTLRSMITTDSVDVPSPSVVPTRELRTVAATLAISQSISDLLQIRLQVGACPFPIDEIKKMLPADVVAGLRMDLNRPFGNSRDDNDNNVVDEPQEAFSGAEPAWIAQADAPERATIPTNFVTAPSSPPVFHASNGIDVNVNSTADNTTDAALARQLFARHLYILMMLLKDQSVANPVLIDFDGDGDSDDVETARGIAQWAINVVDFRDADSIMTPFEFTIHPFANGWTADGDLTTTAEADRAVVWGCERPELLLTETLAFHDRRTEDLPDDSANLSMHVIGAIPNPDANYDQRLRPRGSLFIEVYNPWNTETSTLADGYPSPIEAPGEFYSIAGGVVNGLRLNAVTAVGNSPVWRLIIAGGASINSDPDDPIANPPNPLFQINDVDRAIYFADPQTITDLPITTLNYYTTLPVAPLLPGRYAVVGPAGQPGLSAPPNAFVNTIGRIKVGAVDGSAVNTRRIVLSPNDPSPIVPATNQVQILDNFAPTPYEQPAAADMKPSVAAVMDAAFMNGVTYNYPNFSMSLSEPKSGYVTPGNVTWDQAAATGEGAYSKPIDTPYDNVAFPRDGTTENYRVIHLQRLADPTQAWNPTTNRYLTVDTMSVDLTVFNGVEDPATADDTEIANNLTSVASYQRGDPAILNPSSPILWIHQPANPAAPAGLSPAPGGVVHNIEVALQHSLGYLNQGYGVTMNDTAYKNLAAPANERAPDAAYIGSPKVPGSPTGKPFPWLVWNNRPFVGPMELLLVPKSRSSRLLYDFNPVASNYPVNPPGTAPLPAGAQTSTVGGGHLLDFFQTAAPANLATHFYRLLEHVQVPSRFVGTETELSPQVFGTMPFPVAPPSSLTEADLMSFFYPPFNKVSNYRDPGRVNINTIPSDDASNGSSRIWSAIVGGGNFPAWNIVSQSRQGDGNLVWSPNLSASSMSSSVFSNPFRSATGAALTLPSATFKPPLLPPPPLAPTTLPRNERDVTLLRGSNPTTSTPGDPLLFAYQQTSGATDDPIRNTYFQFANLQRLSNLLTTRSNVYAIWITIGYFEVTSKNNLNTRDLAKYPDGYELGQELGIDTGEVSRHRAFYIYDRSIPVGFEPGKDHNFENGLLLRRFIE